MSVLDKIKNVLTYLFQKHSESGYLQYRHEGNCMSPCPICPHRHNRIFHVNDAPFLPAHIGCDCRYADVPIKQTGSISSKGLESPDVYLKLYGKLPDYYITKEEALQKYGWNNSKNTLSGKAPGKMIGGNIYYNLKSKLPEKNGRIWYECDIDYTNGKRGSKRLYYSNDGLMFYSPDHGEEIFYFVK